MICIKTGMVEMPKNCKECWVICNLVNVNDNEGDYETDKDYFNKRHEDCPLVEVLKM